MPLISLALMLDGALDHTRAAAMLVRHFYRRFGKVARFLYFRKAFGRYQMRLFSIVMLAGLALSGCSAKFSEIHHFASVDKSGEVKNIFRVTVEGNAELTNARYISGFYDERAVDLFFNELSSKSLSQQDRGSGVPPIFQTRNCTGITDEECQEKLDEVLNLVPVGSDLDKQGSFVMILSTNADAIASTIGAFAENEVVMQSVMYLATRDEYEAAADIVARTSTLASGRSATMSTIKELYNLTAPPSDGEPGTGAQRQQIWLSVLRTVAAGLSPDAPPAFADLPAAESWFNTVDQRVP